MERARYLFTIEDRFVIAGRGTVLVPDISSDQLPQPRPSTILLKYSDGRTRTIKAEFEMAFFDPPPPDYRGCLCVLQHTVKDDVPIGAEIWIIIDE